MRFSSLEVFFTREVINTNTNMPDKVLFSYNVHLRPRPLFLALEQSQQGDIGDFDDLETYTGDITDGVTLSSKTSN